MEGLVWGYGRGSLIRLGMGRYGGEWVRMVTDVSGGDRDSECKCIEERGSSINGLLKWKICGDRLQGRGVNSIIVLVLNQEHLQQCNSAFLPLFRPDQSVTNSLTDKIAFFRQIISL